MTFNQYFRKHTMNRQMLTFNLIIATVFQGCAVLSGLLPLFLLPLYIVNHTITIHFIMSLYYSWAKEEPIKYFPTKEDK